MWEFSSIREMLNFLVGDWFGPDPESRLPEIIKSKEETAQRIISMAEISGNDSVLDIGSGPGYIAKEISKKARKVHCIDVSRSFLDYARNYCKECPNVSFSLCDGTTIDLNEQFDVAYASSVFIHFDIFKIYDYMRRISSILKTGGRLWASLNTEENFDIDYFLSRAESYLMNPWGYNDVKWVSKSIIKDIAKYLKFELIVCNKHEFVFKKV